MKLILSIMLAIVLISCSSDDGSDGGGNNPSANEYGVVPFNENSQLYNKDASKYSGDGVIKIRIRLYDNESQSYKSTLMEAGRVSNGIVNLQLPVIDEKYLSEFRPGYTCYGDECYGCTASPKDTKVFELGSLRSSVFRLYNSNGKYIGSFEAMDEEHHRNIINDNYYYGYYSLVGYIYSSKSAKLTCDFDYDHVDIDVAAGWNKVYYDDGYYNYYNGDLISQSAKNILTKEVRWVIFAEGVGCGSNAYFPGTEFCYNGEVKNKCEVNYMWSDYENDQDFYLFPEAGMYDPGTEFCYNESEIRKKCGDASYTYSQYCENGTVKNYGSFTDSRDGKIYKTTVIGTQTWMAQNLNYETGMIRIGLYDWETAIKICPSGWHLPSNEEWLQLIDYVASNSGCCAGKHLKAMSGWSYSNNGENTYGFSAFPSGYVDSNGDFISSYNDYSYWWTSSTNEYDDAYYQYTKNDYTYGGINDKSYSYSVRCVMD